MENIDCDYCSFCDYCEYCNDCNYCEYCNDCNDCNDCNYCNNCSNCDFCDYCNFCKNLVHGFMCINLNFDKKDETKYWIFNKEVTKEEWDNRYKIGKETEE